MIICFDATLKMFISKDNPIIFEFREFILELCQYLVVIFLYFKLKAENSAHIFILFSTILFPTCPKRDYDKLNIFNPKIHMIKLSKTPILNYSRRWETENIVPILCDSSQVYHWHKGLIQCLWGPLNHH